MDPSDEKDYYAILGVPRTADPREVQEAFRRLAKRHHPDHVGDQGTRKFQQIQEAYEVLSHPARRRSYDADLRRRREQVAPSPEPLDPSETNVLRRGSHASWPEPEPLTRPPRPEAFSACHGGPGVRLRAPWGPFEEFVLRDFLRTVGFQPTAWEMCHVCGAMGPGRSIPYPLYCETDPLQAEVEDLIERWLRGFGREW